MYRFVDNQCFAGGFTLGMVQAGFELAGKREMRGAFGVANCEANRHLLGHDWETEAADPHAWTVPAGGADVVAGNPPCSGFSVMSAKSFRGADSKINHCMWAFVEYAARVRPVIAVFESVQLACREGEGRDLMRALRARIEELTGLTYHLYHVKHNAYTVGGAAIRKRYFWLVSQVPFGVDDLNIAQHPTLNDVIGDLRNLELQWEPQQYDDTPASWWAQPRRNAGLHGVPPMTVDGHVATDTPLHSRVRQLIEWAGMRPREAIQHALRRCYETHGTLPPLWKHNEEKLISADFFHGFTAPCRWDGDLPARVVTGAALATVVHPTLDRTITHREAARILGFPDDWLINPLKNVSGVTMTWGKGITVDCGRWIGQLITQALDGNPGEHSGEVVGDRENMIDCTNAWQFGGKIMGKSSKIASATRRKVSYSRVTQGGTIMSEESVAQVDATTQSTSRRGRPRPELTIERDARTLEVLRAGDTTKVTLAATLGVKETEAYLSLHRLHKQGVVRRIRNGSSHTWQLIPEDEREVAAVEVAVEHTEVVEAEEPAEVAAPESEPAPAYGI